MKLSRTKADLYKRGETMKKLLDIVTSVFCGAVAIFLLYHVVYKGLAYYVPVIWG